MPADIACAEDDFIMPPYKVTAKVKSIKGTCAFGMKVGDTLEMSGMHPNGIKGIEKFCLSALSDGLFRYMYSMAFGANLSHTNITTTGSTGTERIEAACTDPYNAVVFEITREKQKARKVNI